MSTDTRTRVVDPTCRFAKREPFHVCVRNTGQPIREGDCCYYESNLRGLEEAFIDATGLGRLPGEPQPIAEPPCLRDECGCPSEWPVHVSLCNLKPLDEPAVNQVAEAVALLLAGCPGCGRRFGPPHGPCREHGKPHCSADVCW